MLLLLHLMLSPLFVHDSSGCYSLVSWNELRCAWGCPSSFSIATPVTQGNTDSQMADTGQPCASSVQHHGAERSWGRKGSGALEVRRDEQEERWWNSEILVACRLHSRQLPIRCTLWVPHFPLGFQICLHHGWFGGHLHHPVIYSSIISPGAWFLLLICTVMYSRSPAKIHSAVDCID